MGHPAAVRGNFFRWSWPWERGGLITNSYTIFLIIYLLFEVSEYNTYVQINKDVRIYSLKQIEWKKKSKSEVGQLSDSTEIGEKHQDKYATYLINTKHTMLTDISQLNGKKSTYSITNETIVTPANFNQNPFYFRKRISKWQIEQLFLLVWLTNF